MKTLIAALAVSAFTLLSAQSALADETNALLAKVNEALAERAKSNQACESGELQLCLERGGDHETMLRCSNDVLNLLKAKLDTQRTKNLDAAKRMEDQQKAVELTPPELVKAEEAANKAFDAYVKSECERQVAYLAGGALTPDRLTVCQIDLLTKQLGLLQKHPNAAQTN